jgi:hypothetical protein
LFFLNKNSFYEVIIGNDVFTVCNLYLISVEIVGCCNRLITSFNGAFFTIIVDEEGEERGCDGNRIIEGEDDFCFQLVESSRI